MTISLTKWQERKMNKLRYLLKEKGLYKVTFVNGASTFMEKRRYVDRGKGQKAKVNLLFIFPFESLKDIEKMAPDISERSLIKSVKKMELALSYDRDFLDRDLLKEFHSKKDKLMKEAAKRGFYKYSTIDEKHHNEFNKWFNSYETQRELDNWCVEGMIGFDETTFERVDYVLFLAFAAGMEAASQKN